MAKLKTGTTINGNTAWHAGNDGTGSGLDADTVDGKHLWSGNNWDRVPLVGSDGVMEIGRYIDFHNTSGDTSDYAVRLDTNGTTGLRINGNNILTTADEGSGNGIDADTLDGQHASAFVAVTGDTMTGNFTTTSGNNGGIYIGSGGSNITSVTPSSKDIVIQDVSQIRFGSASWDWNSWAGLAFNASTEVLTIGGPASSVFSSNTNPPSIDVNFDGLNTSGLKVNNNTVWHAGNDGASSGLDADLLDGNHASAFALASHTHSYLPLSGGTITGNLVTSGANINVSQGNYITFYGGNTTYHSIVSKDNAGNNADDLRINSFGAVYVNLDSNNNNSSAADFMIGRHGIDAGSISELFRVNGETGLITNSAGMEVQGEPVWHGGNLSFSLSGSTLTITTS